MAFFLCHSQGSGLHHPKTCDNILRCGAVSSQKCGHPLIVKVKKSLGYIWDELLPMLYRNYIGIHDEIINSGSLKNRYARCWRFQPKLCLYIFTPRKIGGRSWFPNLTTCAILGPLGWGRWSSPLVGPPFQRCFFKIRVFIHRKHARMCGFHYGTPMEILWTKWKLCLWNYWTQWILFPGFWKFYCGLALLFCRCFTPNCEGCMNPYNFCSTGCPFLVSFI